MASAAAASSSASSSAPSVPVWMPDSYNKKTWSRGTIERPDALNMLAEVALLDLYWVYTPSEPAAAPTPPATAELSVLFSALTTAQPSTSADSSGPSSRSSSTTATPASTPTASPRLSSASTPCTTVVNTPSSEALVLPTKDLLAKATKRVAFAALPEPADDAPQTRKSTRRAARAPAPAPAPPATPAIPASPAAPATPAAPTKAGKGGKAGKRKRVDEEEAEVEEVLALPPRARKARKVVKEEVRDDEVDAEMDHCIETYLDSDDKDSSTPCQKCGKICANKYEKTRHVLTHLPQEQKPYQCPHCRYGAVQKSNRASHVAKKHGTTDSTVAEDEPSPMASTPVPKSPSKSTLKPKAKKQTSGKVTKRR
ncbi:hypothetical protein PsYK624_097710 [Phanerochaete sordida]|uniref:C2H2-type domain-containing protein n=1 Tax=Phanerochaete sordida TaxID=48140 RepID=A0A9P3LFK2_9APHY|nr:hypothetical protein PsYK624_097710 [Phanerochaete sordida]